MYKHPLHWHKRSFVLIWGNLFKARNSSPLSRLSPHSSQGETAKVGPNIATLIFMLQTAFKFYQLEITTGLSGI